MKKLSETILKLLKHKTSSPCLHNKNKEDAEQKPLSMTFGFSKGFTLIELLVVVLIIGILSAVALPKYQIAVEKTRASAMLPVLKSIFDAQAVYYLANGKYSKRFDELDVQLPTGGTLSTDATTMTYPNGKSFDIYVGSDGATYSVRGIADEQQSYLIEYYFNGTRVCYSKKGNNFANRLCKSFSSLGVADSSTHDGYIF